MLYLPWQRGGTQNRWLALAFGWLDLLINNYQVILLSREVSGSLVSVVFVAVGSLVALVG